MRPQMTYEIAMACAKDAGNRSMLAAGRTAWDEDDHHMSVVTFNQLWPDVEYHYITSETAYERTVPLSFPIRCF